MRFVTNVLSTIVLVPPLLTFLRWRSFHAPRAANRRVPDAPDVPDGKRAARQHAGLDAGHRLALLFAPLPFLLWAAVRFGTGGARPRLVLHHAFRYFADSAPRPGFFTPPLTRWS